MVTEGNIITMSTKTIGNIVVAPSFYNALYGINYHATKRYKKCSSWYIHSVIRVVKRKSNHDIAKQFQKVPE